jgi:hypothetical protein
MAWRLEKAVEHGEIDNTVAGTTTGRIWLRGMDEPLLLSMVGDCWRDLAGARLEFTNPTPEDGQSLAGLDPDQVGLVGDMTAARKVLRPAKSDGTPANWCNSLYLEWFSETNGRVLIESTRFKLRISEHVWEMDEDDEEAQKLANLHAMRDFMARVIDRGGQPRDRDADDEEGARIMAESERVSRAFGEVLEKYGDDPESERKEAFVMGWDRKLEALAERDESLGYYDPPPTDAEMNDDDDREADPEAWEDLMDLCEETFGDEEDEEFAGDEEPVVEKSRDICISAMDLVDQQAAPGTPAYRVINGLLEVSGKLTGALDIGYGGASEKNQVLAMLKQCLASLHTAIAALQDLAGAEADADHRAALEELLSRVFDLREDVMELRREIRREM